MISETKSDLIARISLPIVRGDHGLYVDSAGKDTEVGTIVPDGGGENAIIRGCVQVKHQPRDESDGHAGGHIQNRSVLIAPITHQLVNVARLPLVISLSIVRNRLDGKTRACAHRTTLNNGVSMRLN